ncbi:MAG: transcription elongation factor GreA [Bacteroidota bacterium]|jgi:transcription elongation factor GreA
MGLSLFYIQFELTMSTINYYTPEGLQKLKDELYHLKTVQRPAISEQIAEARDKGDLSENAEYDAAKEAQGILEMKIAKMEQIIANARLVDESHIDNSKVFILSKVKIKSQTNGLEIEYTLVAENEADIKLRKISVESPMGKGLLGKKVGDVAEIQTPAGIMNFEILEISR